MKIPQLSMEEGTICFLWLYILFEQFTPHLPANSFGALYMSIMFSAFVFCKKMGWVTDAEGNVVK